MIRLLAVNGLGVLLFGAAYVAGGLRLIPQAVFLAAILVFFVGLAVLWVRTEGSIPHGGDLLARAIRIVLGFLLLVLAAPGVILGPLFTLQEGLPPDSGMDRIVPGVMFTLLASLLLVGAMNLVGVCIMVGSALVRRVRG